MHRAALAGGAAIGLPVQFGHHGVETAALGKIDCMSPIAAGGEIVRVQDITYPDRDGFLANRQVNRAFNAVAWIDFGAPLLDPPD